MYKFTYNVVSEKIMVVVVFYNSYNSLLGNYVYSKTIKMHIIINFCVHNMNLIIINIKWGTFKINK